MSNTKFLKPPLEKRGLCPRPRYEEFKFYKDVVRAALYQISAELKKSGVTVLISAEKTGNEELSRYGVGEFVADGVIELELIKGQQEITRRLFVKKLRGMGYRSGVVEFEILEDGFKVFPKIPMQRLSAKTHSQIRKTFGIEKLDELFRRRDSTGAYGFSIRQYWNRQDRIGYAIFSSRH